MAGTRQRYTYADLAAMPDDDQRYEIVEGELFVVPPPTTEHQLLSGELYDLLRRAQKAGYGTALYAPVDVIFDPDVPKPENVTQPDLLFIKRGGRATITRANVQRAPDLIIEILSPSTRNSDLGRKLRIYERFGVEYYWLVDPDRCTVQPLVLRGGKYVAEPSLGPGDQLGCPLFPGIVLDDVGSLFPAR